jgi:hypothetical protein
MTDRTYTCVVTGAGVGTVTVDTDRRMTWSVQQVSSEMATAPGTAACVIRKNGYLVTQMIAQADVAGGDPPVELLPSDVMTVVWTGATPGDVGKVLVTYDEVP